MGSTKFYRLFSILFLAGFGWLLFQLFVVKSNIEAGSVCIMKNVTGIPCPSCGSTRAVIAIFHGHFSDALLLNPLGFILVTLMIVIPVWLMIDLASKKKSLYKAYLNAETILRKPHVTLPLILLVVANWVWNIAKGI